MAANKSEEVVARSEEIRAWNILLYLEVLDSVRLGVVIGTRGDLGGRGCCMGFAWIIPM